MGEFTYETRNRTQQYETYEWDNTWLDHPNDDIKRVLYIGDSIACSTRYAATEQSGGKMVFDLFGTSRAVDNPYFKDALTVFANQQGGREAIIFNNGLHGWHLNDEIEFKKYYEDMVRYLLNTFRDIPVAIVLSTTVKKEEDERRVIVRNKSAREVAGKYNLPVIDLYTTSKEAQEFLSDDGVHFTLEGYRILAKKIVEEVSNLL